MKQIIDTLYNKLAINELKEDSDWKEGYSAGVSEAIEVVEKSVYTLLVPGNNYFVIMYKNGNKHIPYVAEMRLYKISVKTRKSYCFSFNLNATRFNTYNPDLVLASEKGLIERVFLTKEKAEEAIAL